MMIRMRIDLAYLISQTHNLTYKTSSCFVNTSVTSMMHTSSISGNPFSKSWRPHWVIEQRTIKIINNNRAIPTTNTNPTTTRTTTTTRINKIIRSTLRTTDWMKIQDFWMLVWVLEVFKWKQESISNRFKQR